LIKEGEGGQPCPAEAEVCSRSSLRSSLSPVSPLRSRLQIEVFGLSRNVFAIVHSRGSWLKLGSWDETEVRDLS
jgi:hypothetical protein